MANPKNEKRLKNKLLVFFGGLLGPIFLRFFYNTNKWTIDNAHYYQDALSNGKSVIIASWHNTLLTVFMGLSKKEILLLVKQTAIGATAMFCEAKEPINILRENVTSKGGTTETALETLNKYEFTEGVQQAVLNAKERSINLGSELNSEIQENTQK